MNILAHEKKAMAVAIIAGILLIVSGTSGLATWTTISEFVTRYVIDNIYVHYAFAVLIFIASLGGLSVIIGGSLIGAHRVTTGKIIIGIGAGAGLIGLIISVIIAVYQNSLAIGEYVSVGFVGILLSILARQIPKKDEE